MTKLMNKLEAEDFRLAIGDSFAVMDGDTGVVATSLRLTDLSMLPVSHAKMAEPFSLIFEGTNENLLEQATYLFQHPHMGDLTIFIVPVGSNGETCQYQAIFN